MQRLDTPNGRYYKTEHGTFPSVTTVLGATPQPRKQRALEEWRENEKNHEQIFHDAGIRGTFIHRRVELALTGMSQPGYSEEEKRVLVPQYWKSIVPVVRKIKHPLYCERMVVNPELGYAGTLDTLAARSAGSSVCTILDWKNARRWRKREWIEDYFLQVAAYRVAASSCLDPKPIIADGLIVVALPDRPAQQFPLSRAELNFYYNAFKKRMVEFRSLSRGSRVSVSATKRMFQYLGRGK
jgi:hypothetical protein